MVGKRSSDVDHHVRKRIRERRREIGMSQAKLGNALGVTYQQVQKYELGLNRVSASRLWDMAKALEVDVGYFFESIQKRAGRGRKPRKAKTTRRKSRSAGR